MVDENLRQYATDKQWSYYLAVQEHGTGGKASAALGIAKSSINRSLAAMRRKAVMHGYAPDHDMIFPAPDGMKSAGTSTLYDMQTGNARIQWVKFQADKERQDEMLREATAAMAEEMPRLKPIAAPKSALPDLLNLYTITDYHLGMLASAKDGGGADWDIKIAEDTLIGCFSQMMAGAPNADTAIICQLGDFLHTDFPGLRSETPLSGHSLDTDGRAGKVVGVALRVLRGIIDMALSKHAKVHVIMGEGNHDITSSIWLRQCFAALYEKDIRVTIDVSELPFYAYRHGKTMLAFHHGHLKKPGALTGYFAAQFSKMWGDTQWRYGHSGHLHHADVKEDLGMVITQHQTLSAKDAYATRGGWFAERKAECTTYSKKFGKVASNQVTPAMLSG